MLDQRKIESFVGFFLLLAIFAMLVLAFKVSGLTSFFKMKSYTVTAEFDDIGSLKVRSPVKVSGVLVGEVSAISLDPTTFKAVVKIAIERKFNAIPDDSSIAILTAGLLGDNYLAISPMYSQTFLKNGSVIQDTHSAMILEKLIGQLIYKIGNPEKPEAAAGTAAPVSATPSVPASTEAPASSDSDKANSTTKGTQ